MEILTMSDYKKPFNGGIITGAVYRYLEELLAQRKALAEQEAICGKRWQDDSESDKWISEEQDTFLLEQVWSIREARFLAEYRIGRICREIGSLYPGEFNIERYRERMDTKIDDGLHWAQEREFLND